MTAVIKPDTQDNSIDESTAADALQSGAAVDEESAVSRDQQADDATYRKMVERLSRLSVTKNFDAYVDIAWDDPDMEIRHDDPRWALSDTDALGRSDWYQGLPADTQSVIGLHLVAAKMKTGLQFENILKRGLLEYAAQLPDGSPEFRYAYHETIEEAQHGLMFQEFVNRAGLPVPGLPWDAKVASSQIVKLGRRFPELFFVFVLGGEDPIDHTQRKALRGERELHPLLERIMRIHVTEEARHLSFARHYLNRTVPELSTVRKEVLRIAGPIILGTMAQLMYQAPKALVKRYDIPADVVKAAYKVDPQHQQDKLDALRKIRTLYEDLGLVLPVSKRIWKAYGLWDNAIES